MLERAPAPDSQSGAVEGVKTIAGACGELLRSAAYSAVVEPLRGGAQIVDRTVGARLGTQLESSVVNLFGALSIQQPTDRGYGSASWHMQQLGGALGMMVPFGLLLGRVRAYPVRDFLPTAFGPSSEIAVAALGYGLTRPLADPAQGNFAWEKSKQALGDASIMGTAGFVAPHMRRYTALATGSLERSALPSLVKDPLLAGISPNFMQQRILPGLLTAVPAGFVAAQVEGWKRGNAFTLDRSVAQQIYGAAYIAPSIGLAQRIATVSAPRPRTAGN